MNTIKAKARRSPGGTTQHKRGAWFGGSMALLAIPTLALLLSIIPASGIVTQNKSLPTPDGAYEGSFQIEFQAHLEHGGAVYSDPVHVYYLEHYYEPPTIPNITEMETFTSTIYLRRTQGGVTDQLTATGMVTVAITLTGTSSNGTSFYRTEMTDMAMSGGTMPEFLGIRENPSLMSTGMTTITPIQGGGYEIESFFDIWLEMTSDGGISYEPMSNRVRMSLFKRPNVVAPLDFGPPSGGSYVSPGAEEYAFQGGLIKIRKVQHDQLPPIELPHFQAGLTNVVPDTRVQFEYSTDGGSIWHNASVSAGMTTATRHVGSSPPFEIYDTEMTTLALGAGNVLIRESPTRASKGRYHTEVTGGGSKASSFFDVWLEVSTDAGQSWAPSERSVHMELRTPTTVQSIPTLSQWGLAILTVLLVAVGVRYLRRQPAPSAPPAAV